MTHPSAGDPQDRPEPQGAGAPQQPWQDPHRPQWQPPAGDPSAGEPPAAAAPPGTARSGRGLVIAGVALVAALVLSGAVVVGWLLTQGADRDGPASPTAAVDGFLIAVYQDLDADEAATWVCSEARDVDTLTAKIDSIREYDALYPDPRFSWDEPELVDTTDGLATVAVTVTMITDDERTADQELRVTVLDKDPHGWWVCNVDSLPADGDSDQPEDTDEPDTDEPDDDGDTDTGDE
jgi:hypothetical protein